MSQEKPRLSFWQLINMNMGCFGIQFGWGLQMVNTSAIFEHLGAYAHQIPILWLAAPMTGLIVQPIIGNLSDNTWNFLGRRRPYFLAGAILAAVALVLMPNSTTLWMAAGTLWILDTSANISMEPFRAFVGDLLPEDQRTQGFAMQSLFIGLGAVSASILPWILTHGFGIAETGEAGRTISLTVKLSFYIGAVCYLGTVLWTILTTPEYPPDDMEVFAEQQAERGGLLNSFGEIWQAMQQMPATMRQLTWVQFFTWAGMFCIFIYFPPAVARNIFGATREGSLLYAEGIEWAGICFAVYNAVCFGFSFVLPRLERATSSQIAHAFCLLCGGVGLLSLMLIDNKYLLFLPMIGVGIAWSGILAMPYAMLVSSLPRDRTGIYMGIFNFFIVLPQIAVSLGYGWVMRHLLHENRLTAVIMGGGFLVIAALLMWRVQLVPDSSEIDRVELVEDTRVRT